MRTGKSSHKASLTSLQKLQVQADWTRMPIWCPITYFHPRWRWRLQDTVAYAPCKTGQPLQHRYDPFRCQAQLPPHLTVVMVARTSSSTQCAAPVFPGPAHQQSSSSCPKDITLGTHFLFWQPALSQCQFAAWPITSKAQSWTGPRHPRNHLLQNPSFSNFTTGHSICHHRLSSEHRVHSSKLNLPEAP